jgi:hypothetical protein
MISSSPSGIKEGKLRTSEAVCGEKDLFGMINCGQKVCSSYENSQQSSAKYAKM